MEIPNILPKPNPTTTTQNMSPKPCIRNFFDKNTNTWTYLVVCTVTKQCALIDTVLDFDMPSGSTTTTSADKLIQIIENEKLSLQWILETHVHADHLTASAYLKDYFGGKPIVAIGEHIKDVLEHWVPIFWGAADDTTNAKNHNNACVIGDRPPTDGSQFDKLFAHGEKFSIGAIVVDVIHTPGHTPACVTYHLVDADIAFVGDTIFMPEVGTARTDFPGGSPQILYDSCRTLMNKCLKSTTVLHVGHDYPCKDKSPHCSATVSEHLKSNCMMNERVSQKEFVDANQDELPVPRLLLPALQINLRAGRFGAGRVLTIPLNCFNKCKAKVSKL